MRMGDDVHSRKNQCFLLVRLSRLHLYHSLVLSYFFFSIFCSKRGTCLFNTWSRVAELSVLKMKAVWDFQLVWLTLMQHVTWGRTGSSEPEVSAVKVSWRISELLEWGEMSWRPHSSSPAALHLALSHLWWDLNKLNKTQMFPACLRLHRLVWQAAGVWKR